MFYLAVEAYTLQNRQQELAKSLKIKRQLRDMQQKKTDNHSYFLTDVSNRLRNLVRDFNMVARIPFSDVINSLKPKGRYLIANPRISDMLKSIMTSKFTDKSVIFGFAGEKEEELLTLKDMIEKGRLKSTVDKIYPIEQAVEAHRRVETEQRLGIVVISLERT